MMEAMISWSESAWVMFVIAGLLSSTVFGRREWGCHWRTAEGWMEPRKTTVKTAHGGNRLWKFVNSMGLSAFAFPLHLLQCFGCNFSLSSRCVGSWHSTVADNSSMTDSLVLWKKKKREGRLLIHLLIIVFAYDRKAKYVFLISGFKYWDRIIAFFSCIF